MRYILSVVGVVVALCLAIAELMGLHMHFWLAELVVSVSPQVVVAIGALLLASGLLAIPALLQGGTRRIASSVLHGVVVVLWVYLCAFTSSVQQPRAVESASGGHLVRVAAFNKLHSNTNFKRIGEYIGAQNIDIVSFEELEPGDIQKIAKFTNLHYYIGSSALGGKFTTVDVMSKYPLAGVKFVSLGGGYSYMRGEVDVPGVGRHAIYGAHITPPFSDAMYEQGAEQIESLASVIANERLPTVLGGDFNTTVYSPKLRNFNSEISAKARPTTVERWPSCSWFGYGPLACMQIDHIYTPPYAALHSLTIFPDLGSDHRMVVVGTYL